MTFDYDELCLQNKIRNTAVLQGLGSSIALEVPKAVKQPKQQRAPKKRKATPPSSETESEGGKKVSKRRKGVHVAQPPSKHTDDEKEPSPETNGLRRSGRNRKKVDYSVDNFDKAKPQLASSEAGLRDRTSEPKMADTRKHDPKVFGAIPGISVGTWWLTREECSKDAIHAPWVGGIAGGSEGAYSVALSGGYEDDVDLGDAFTYTGAGGRDLKGTAENRKNLRTAPQSSHQSFDNRCNRALKVSCETKNPVRVIRGFKLRSPYAPAEGYRYDGLYTVEKAWMEKGLNPGGWMVCKFALKRVPGQAPLKLGGDEGNTDPSSEDDDAVNEEAGVEDDAQGDEVEADTN